MQASELNAAAAKLMGFGVFAKNSFMPANISTHAWGFAQAMKVDFGFSSSNSAWVLRKGDYFGEPHDGTPQDAARALTTCVLRANGVEVPPLAAERKTNDSK